jgi:hypothetical protein
MTCLEAKASIDALVDGELPPGETRALRDHLRTCVDCAREHSERQAFSATLARAFDQATPGRGSPAPGREGLAERLHQESRRRVFVPARLAAALVFGLSVGLVVSALGLSRATREQEEIARQLYQERSKAEQVKVLTQEIGDDVEGVRKTVPAAAPEDSEVLLTAVNVIESSAVPPAEKGVDQLLPETASSDFQTRSAAKAALRRLSPEKAAELRAAMGKAPRYDPEFAARLLSGLEERQHPADQARVSIQKMVNGASVGLIQFADGRVRLTVPGRTLEARTMIELLREYGEVCRQFGISGREGRLTVGESAATVDLRGRLDLLLRAGTWDDDVQWEAYRARVAARIPDPAEVDRRLRALQERCRQAADPRDEPAAQVDLEAILRNVKSLTRRELEETRERAEKQVKELDERLRLLKELRTRARGLRVYAEEAKRDH